MELTRELILDLLLEVNPTLARELSSEEMELELSVLGDTWEQILKDHGYE